jgi:cytochrome oxidase Cu insertion factor (SCO1/SenC/PrrC family)
LPVLACLVLGALGGVGTALVTKSDEEDPALVRFEVPRQPPPYFRLRDENGTWRTPASAGGDVLVVTFIYTNCRDLCPRQAAEIKEAVVAAGGGVQVYAITVDPETDTPRQARAWLERMGVAGGPVHILLGSRRELTPVWQRFGIVPIKQDGNSQPPPDDPGKLSAQEQERLRQKALADRPAPEGAHEEFPSLDDGSFRGRARHLAGVDFEHSAYALLIDKHGRQRVGFPYEQITSELLLTDFQALKAEQ